MIRKNGRLMLSTIVVALLLFAGLLPFVSNGSQAAIPTWEKGDKWALAGEKDLGGIYDSMGPLL